MIIKKVLNESWGIIEFYLLWDGKEVKVKRTPEGGIKEKATLSEVMEAEGLPKSLSTNQAIEVNKVVGKAKEILSSLIIRREL
jgi:hypothetical protein